MRLDDGDRSAIVAAIQARDPNAEIWLYGSRARDDARGGDIDLLVISSSLGLSEKLDILQEIKLKIGDQRIDLTLSSPGKMGSDPWVTSIISKALRLDGNGS